MAVARLGSLARAAQSMHLTVPALSRRIALLEAQLGMPLFRRLPRGLALTESGAAYFAAIGPAWESLATATEAMRGAGRRPLRLTVMPSFAAQWLVPRLGGWASRHAGTEIELETGPEPVDLRARPDLDGAIRLGIGPWPGLLAEPFLPVLAFPVARPGLAVGPDAAALLRLPLIGTTHQPEFWREYLAAHGVAEPAPPLARSFDNLSLVYEAAAAGQGVALGLDPVVRPYLQAGRLVALPPGPVRLSRQFHLVRRRGAGRPGRAMALFRDWLRREAAAFLAAPCTALNPGALELNGGAPARPLASAGEGGRR